MFSITDMEKHLSPVRLPLREVPLLLKGVTLHSLSLFLSCFSLSTPLSSTPFRHFSGFLYFSIVLTALILLFPLLAFHFISLLFRVFRNLPLKFQDGYLFSFLLFTYHLHSDPLTPVYSSPCFLCSLFP